MIDEIGHVQYESSWTMSYVDATPVTVDVRELPIPRGEELPSQEDVVDHVGSHHGSGGDKLSRKRVVRRSGSCIVSFMTWPMWNKQDSNEKHLWSATSNQWYAKPKISNKVEAQMSV